MRERPSKGFYKLLVPVGLKSWRWQILELTMAGSSASPGTTGTDATGAIGSSGQQEHATPATGQQQQAGATGHQLRR